MKTPMSYMVWDDRRNTRANLHRDTCTRLGQQGGNRSKPPYYGPYSNVDDALRKARELRDDVHPCSWCMGGV